MLGADSRQAGLVAVAASPAGVAGLQAFDRRERLGQVPDWLYLTGSPPRLPRVGRLRAGRAGAARQFLQP